MTDRSSKPHCSPSRLSARVEHRIVALRFVRRWGPHRIGYHLHLNRSTIERVSARYRMPKLVYLDQATGLPARRPKVVRDEKTAPGEPVHVDIKKQGRIPESDGWRAHGRDTVQTHHAAVARDRAARNGAPASHGYSFLHHAVDDHSRLAYSEILGDEKQETATGFRGRANAFFASAGTTVTAVTTDNGSCYRSHVFAAASEDTKHVWTRPYRPKTNEKVERFNHTPAQE